MLSVEAKIARRLAHRIEFRKWVGTDDSIVSLVPFMPRSFGRASDGRLLATGAADGLAHGRETTSGRELATMSGHGALVIRAAFSPDGKRLLTSSMDQTIKLWDVRTGRELMTLVRKTNWCRSGFAFSSDGRQIVLGDGLEHVLVLTAVDWQ